MNVMVLSLNKVKELILSSSLVKNPKISFLAEGHGNCNYIVEENNKKLILRIKKSTETQFDDSLEREYVFLKFFDSQGIDFCPKAIYYNKDKKYLIETFIEGKKNFSRKLLKKPN